MPAPTAQPIEHPPSEHPSPQDYATGLRQVSRFHRFMLEAWGRGSWTQLNRQEQDLEAIVETLPGLFQRDVLSSILRTLRQSGHRLIEIADQEELEPVQAKVLGEQVSAQVEILNRFAPLSDEYEVRGVSPGAPKTYKRALQILQRNPTPAQLRAAGRNLERLGQNDLQHPLLNQVRNATGQLLEAGKRVRWTTDSDFALHQLKITLRAIHALEDVRQSCTGLKVAR